MSFSILEDKKYLGLSCILHTFISLFLLFKLLFKSHNILFGFSPQSCPDISFGLSRITYWNYQSATHTNQPWHGLWGKYPCTTQLFSHHLSWFPFRALVTAESLMATWLEASEPPISIFYMNSWSRSGDAHTSSHTTNLVTSQKTHVISFWL